MRRPILLLSTAVSLFAWGIANAEAYVCTTKSGSDVRTDHFPPECADVVTRVLYPDGALKETINPPENQAERQARAAKSKREEVEKAIQEAQANNDHWLRDRFHSLKDIDEAWDKALKDQKAARMVASAGFKRRADELKDLDEQDEFFAKGNRPWDLNEKYKTNAEATKQLINTMEKIEEQIDAINKDFASKRKRYAELDSLFDNSRATK
jgi:hypothetical protein